MTGQLLPDVIFRMLDSSGNPISGGTATFYLTGTLDVAAIYSNAALSVTLANPLSTNAGGLFVSGVTPTAVYLDPTVTYRAIFKDASGTTIRDIDPVSVISSAASTSFTQAGTGAATQTVQTKLRQYVSANDFTGVDPTGVADSTDGLKALFDYALPLGKGVELQGEYLVSGPISSVTTLTDSGLHIRCIGKVAINVATGSTAFRFLLYCTSNNPNNASITGDGLVIDMNDLGAEAIYIRHNSATTGGVVDFSAPVTILNCKQNDATQVNVNAGITIIGDYDTITLNSPRIENVTRTNTGGGACVGIFASGFSGTLTMISPYVEGVLTGNGSAGADADGISFFGKGNSGTTKTEGTVSIINPVLVDNQGRSIKSQCSDTTIINPKIFRRMVVSIASINDIDFQKGSGVVIEPEFEYRLNGATTPLGTGFSCIAFQQSITDAPMSSKSIGGTLKTEAAMSRYANTLHSATGQFAETEVSGLRVVPIGTFATAAFTRGVLEFTASEIEAKTVATSLIVRDIYGQLGCYGITYTGYTGGALTAKLSVEVTDFRSTLTTTAGYVFREQSGTAITAVKAFLFRNCYGIRSLMPDNWTFSFDSLVAGCQFVVNLAAVSATNPPGWAASGYAMIESLPDIFGTGLRTVRVTVENASTLEGMFFTNTGGTTWGANQLINRTAAQIADKTNSINTVGKRIGRMTWDSTNNRLMVASSSADTSAWYICDGSGSVVPA